MISQRRFFAIFLVPILIGISTSAGTIIKVEFNGLVNLVEPGLPFSDGIGIGDLFHGTYSYDTEAPDDVPNDASLGGYSFLNHVLSVEFGEFIFATPDLGISIYNRSSPLFDGYSVFGRSNSVAYGLEWRVLGFSLADTTGTAFDSDALPVGPPNLDSFGFERVFLLTQRGQRDPSIRGTITSLTLVPEPTTFILLAGASLLVLNRHRATRRSARP